MKRKLLLCLATILPVFFLSALYAQTQLENAGFEEWEEIGFGPNITEPVNWSSVKSTDDDNLNGVAPVVWGRSNDAHSGDYSLYLFSKEVFGVVATGMITNGRVHADLNLDSSFTFTDPDHEEWHTRISAKPDSLTGWYRANPQPGDHGHIKVVIHRGYIEVSASKDTTGFIGSANIELPGEVVDTWTRFSAPIQYYKEEDPEFVLITISSSVGVNAVGGSELWLDDFEFIYNNGTGIGEESHVNIELYAAAGSLHIFVKNRTPEKYTLTVYDLTGKLLIREKGVTQQLNTHTHRLQHGIYVAKISYEDKIFSKKIAL